jgi:hypothetical protein
MSRHIHKEKLTPCRIYYVVCIWFNVNRVFAFFFSFLKSIILLEFDWMWIRFLCLGFSWRCVFWSFFFHIIKISRHTKRARGILHIKVCCFHLVCCFLNLNSSSCKCVRFLFILHILCLLMWHMSSAQVWRWLCNCFECEHDLNDRAQLWNIIILKF